MLYRFSDFRPHSSPDPFGATLPPGEGIFSPLRGGGRFLNRPYAPKQKRRGRPPGRPTENLRFSATRPLGGGRDVEDAVPYKMDQATTPAVIARPQAVVIPSIFRVALVPRDCHVALRLLAMT